MDPNILLVRSSPEVVLGVFLPIVVQGWQGIAVLCYADKNEVCQSYSVYYKCYAAINSMTTAGGPNSNS